MPANRGIKVKKVRVNTLNEELDLFDDSFPKGVFIEPRNPQKREQNCAPC